MQLDSTLENQPQDMINKTVSGYSSYTGRDVFVYEMKRIDRQDDKNLDDDKKQIKYIETEEIFLAP